MEFTKVPKDIMITRILFLRGLALIYLIANLSLYFQIQGLFGDEGIHPAKNFMSKLKETFKDRSLILNFPTLLLFSDSFNLISSIFPYLKNFSAEENTLHLLCLISIMVALSICLNITLFYNSFGFFILWLIYLSFYLVGQNFINDKWDLLLIETGFLAIMYCPTSHSLLNQISFTHQTVYYLLRLLMFRLTFSSGVLKIQSGCQQWANLEALNYLFQSTPSPHYFSLILNHYLSDILKKMIIALIYVIEVMITS